MTLMAFLTALRRAIAKCCVVVRVSVAAVGVYFMCRARHCSVAGSQSLSACTLGAVELELEVYQRLLTTKKKMM